ncbi:sulfotransferase family protein [Phormidium sp. CCY1219]|uniref:sulfotransferase family protein n=1 Tax=Phormidium sp. CCY1219 TaxID=2886104 RepID=UPI002D1F5A96|nr:sulfotransferase [Phormidium sp. CCY1219]MEB3829323.1 sulfotransferase domain-containing protein [Phormidium sp. CCY1219]
MQEPNFFIVGAPKCGTTALSEYLRTHPQVYMSSPKEPHYFAEDYNHTPFTTWERYLELFADATAQHKAVGEASVHYLCSDVALENIRRVQPTAKIIAMLRNPVELVYSYHSQLLYNTGEDEPDFEKAWRLQGDRQTGKFLPKRCSNPRVLQYKHLGQLGSQVEKLLAVFPASQVKLILFDDFKASPKKIYDEVLEFLQVPSDNRVDFPRVNANKGHKNPLLGQFTEKTPSWAIAVAKKTQSFLGIESFGIMNAIRKVNAKPQERTPLSPDFRAELIEEFRAENDKLSHILQRDLSHWMS